MSYILNALRKSEQERQAHQAETITDQVLMPPPQKTRKTAVLIAGLLAINLLAIPLIVWYLKKADETPAKPQTAMGQAQNSTVQKPLPIAVKPDENVNEVASVSDAEEKTVGEKMSEPAPARRIESTPIPVAAMPAAKTPSIEDLAKLKQVEDQKPAKLVPPEDNKKSHDRSGQLAQAHPAPALGQQAQRLRALQTGDSVEEEENVAPEINTDAEPHAGNQIPLLNDLPYAFRSSAPKMTINVFMYAERPEDRFVVLNMTKYRAGQMTKDSVLIKEIRPDSVVASYGGRIFRIERP